MPDAIDTLVIGIIILMAIAIFGALFQTSSFQGMSEPWKSTAKDNVDTLLTGLLLIMSVGGISLLAYLRSGHR